MLKRKTLSETIFQILLIMFFILFSICTLYPFVSNFSLSFMTPGEANRIGIKLIPREVTLDAYIIAFSSGVIMRAYMNSILRVVVGTSLSILTMIMGAYALSKKYLPHRNFYTMFIVITMFIGGGLIPTYLLIMNLGMLNTFWALVIPGMISTFSMVIIRNFFMNLPDELEESAKMDGANDILILFKIIVPISLPVIATVSLWTAVGHWNSWFDAMIYVSSNPKMMTLALFLRRIIIENDVLTFSMMDTTERIKPAFQATLKAAVLMLTTLPILIVYPFLQKYFVQGIMVGSLKG